MADAKGAIAVFDGLRSKIKQLIKDVTRSAVRRKKMTIQSINTTNQTVTVYEAANPSTTITVPYRCESGISQLSVGQSVQVEWIYDDLSTAVAVCPGKGWASLQDVQDAIGAGGGGGGGNYLPLTGGTLTGQLTLQDALNTGNNKWHYWYSADGTKKFGILGLNNNNIVGVGSASCGLRIHNSTDIAVDNPDYWRQALGSDATPTVNSTNFVESGGVYTSIAAKQDKLTLLWTNSSPTAAFASQTILNDNSLASYDLFAIKFKEQANSTGSSEFIFWYSKTSGSNVTTARWVSRSGSNLFFRSRSFSLTDNGLTFNGGEQHTQGSSSATANNAYMVPWEVYGLKL